jgi:hypothetical protein
MNSSTATGGHAPRKALKVFRVRRTAPKCGGLKQEKAVRTAITAAGADENTRAGKRKRKAGAASARKGTIESIMSSAGAASAPKGTIESIMSSAGAVGKTQACRKRKAGRKAITAAPSSSSSEDESGSGEEADIRDGTDVLEFDSTAKVTPSSLKDTESSDGASQDSGTKSFATWQQDCECPKGTLKMDCGCDAGF